MAARRIWKMWNRNQEIWKQLVSKRVFLESCQNYGPICTVYLSFLYLPAYLSDLKKTYIHISYLRACVPQCKHKRQHLSSGHWRRLQSYRTKDCQSHNGLLKSHISSCSQFSIRISTKLQHQNIDQTSAWKSPPNFSFKIMTKPQLENLD